MEFIFQSLFYFLGPRTLQCLHKGEEFLLLILLHVTGEGVPLQGEGEGEGEGVPLQGVTTPPKAPRGGGLQHRDGGVVAVAARPDEGGGLKEHF